jgi:predicted nucleic acid-binding protein
VILVDTSIWIDHLRAGSQALTDLLHNHLVCSHNAVIGELACGNLVNRKQVLALLQALPRPSTATDSETLFFIEQQRLMARGIGYIDAQLLATCAIHSIQLWTKDKRLRTVAEALSLDHLP